MSTHVRSSDPWPENYVRQRWVSRENVDHLREVLLSATDERPLQQVLQSTPALLRALTVSPHDFWCFDHPSLGSEHVPDFLLCCRTSAGFMWKLVEIESPVAAVLTKSGRPARKLREAMGQIDDWRIWLRRNIAYAHNELCLRGIDAEVPAIIIIGRRSEIHPENTERYRQLSKGNLEIMTYDRLVDLSSQ